MSEMMDNIVRMATENGMAVFEDQMCPPAPSIMQALKPLCDTTMTPRNPIDTCVCIERTDEMGPCDKFEAGGNGRCVYCDHEEGCHPKAMKTYEFLSPAFLEAMNDIGRYGHEKYGAQSFQHRRLQGDTSRGDMERTLPEVIGEHVRNHYQMHLDGVPHDHFKTRIHQIAAASFNCMMEAYFAGLEDEPLPVHEG